MYKIKLDQFEGPLDLLLFFIKRDELDIYDIPISKITKEFLEYVNLIKMLDLETAGDFILMASTLMRIKVRMLLPREIDEKGEEIDPRSELIQALLEYKKYKEVSEELSYMESKQRKINFRGNFQEDFKVAPPDFDTLLKNITVFDLAKAFKTAIDNIQPEIVHEIEKINITIDEQIIFILDNLLKDAEVNFLKLVAGMNEKIRIVITFIALLELTKVGEIGLRASNDFNDFIIYKTTNGQNIQINN
ncbi:MAG: segregation/condensation protein A [Bacteroidetes bacterium]|nr:segregation/condensation protein A [Bacteroidota bacterium]